MPSPERPSEVSEEEEGEHPTSQYGHDLPSNRRERTVGARKECVGENKKSNRKYRKGRKTCKKWSLSLYLDLEGFGLVLVENRIAFPSSISFKDEFSSVEPSAVEEEEELLDGGSGPKDVCSPKNGEPTGLPGPESGTLASDRYVGTRAEEDSRGAEREAQAKVSRDLPRGQAGGCWPRGGRF